MHVTVLLVSLTVRDNCLLGHALAINIGYKWVRYIRCSTEHIPEMAEVLNLSIMPALFAAVNKALKISNQDPFVCEQTESSRQLHI